ncbi:hypothetical protein ACVMH6_004467 [Rhizobium leguminosarum]
MRGPHGTPLLPFAGRSRRSSLTLLSHPLICLPASSPRWGEGTQAYRFKLPKIPRTSARPTWVATVRATLFIAASTTVSRW